MKEKIEKEIALSQEVFQSLPTNNLKNQKRFLSEIEKEIAAYQEKQNEIYTELVNRQKPYLALKEHTFQEYSDAIENLAKALSYTNNLSTAYEKLRLDKSIYQLSRYKTNRLSENNRILKRIISLFAKVGISLQASDFHMTNFSHQYMEAFFSYQNYINSGTLEKVFEELYWKDPYLILEIELNIRHLYLKHQKKFEQYIAHTNEQLLSRFQHGEKNLIDDYSYLCKKLEMEQFGNKENLLYSFVSGSYNIDDYVEAKIKPLVSQYFGSAFEEKEEELKSVAFKLLHSLEEYQNYKKYETLIDKIRSLYGQELDRHVLQKHFKKIGELEKKLSKLNKKSRVIVSKTKVDKLGPEINQVISEIQSQYQEVDQVMFHYVVKEHIKENSTIFKSLLLVSQYYAFLTDMCLEKDPQMTYEMIEEEHREFYRFVLNPNNTIINNLTITEHGDVTAMLISNYRLLGVNLKEEMLSSNQLEQCKTDLKRIIIYYQLRALKVSVDDLLRVKKIQKIMEKKESAR